jgi:type VI secretion system ImpA family protein
MIDDQARILQPIAPEKPCGESLRYEGAYDRIREARQEEDPRLPQGVWVTKPKAADWDFVCRTCVELLETRTKDLQIAAWLTEALVQLHGFVGLHEGLFIVLRLCERYGDCLHAGADGTDAESRSAPILWLNEKVADRLKWVPLVQTGAASDAQLNVLRFENLGTAGDPVGAAASGTATTVEGTAGDLPAEVFQTDPAFYVANLDAIRGAIATCEQIEKFFASKAVVDAPSLYRVRENLHKALSLTERFMARQLPLETDDPGQDAP